jgi:hypothetical protein
MRGDVLAAAGGSIIATGPFVLTDATAAIPTDLGGSNGAHFVVQPSAASCVALTGPLRNPGYVATVYFGAGPSHAEIHGARYIVPAGQMLCAYPAYSNGTGYGEVLWAGFQPY